MFLIQTSWTSLKGQRELFPNSLSTWHSLDVKCSQEQHKGVGLSAQNQWFGCVGEGAASVMLALQKTSFALEWWQGWRNEALRGLLWLSIFFVLQKKSGVRACLRNYLSLGGLSLTMEQGIFLIHIWSTCKSRKILADSRIVLAGSVQRLCSSLKCLFW